MAYKASAQAVYDLKYHIVWAPQYRQDLLVGEVAHTVQALFQQIAAAYDIEMATMEVMEDQVHLFLSAPPRYAPARIVHILKSISARELFARFPRLRRRLWGGQLWEDGYFVRSVGDAVTAEILRRYIGCVPPFTRGVLRHEIGFARDRALRPLVQASPGPLSSPSLIHGQVCRHAGDRRAVTVPMPFESAVTEMSQDAFVGSAIANGVTIIPFDLRPRDLHHEFGAPSTLSGRKEAYHVDIHELSTCHNPIKYRFLLTQGYVVEGPTPRMDCTPALKGVSTAQHMSHSTIRVAGDLAVGCGVSLRHMALLVSVLFLMPLTKSSSKRGIDDIGSHLPTPEEMLRHLLALTPVTACPSDG